MELNEAKGLCIVIQFTSSLIIGCLPYLLLRREEANSRHVRIRELVISFLKCFSGGVFMAALLLNLMPEGMEAMEDYFAMKDIEPDYPVFLVIVALGFFIIASVEQFAHCLKQKHKVDPSTAPAHEQPDRCPMHTVLSHYDQNQEGGRARNGLETIATIEGQTACCVDKTNVACSGHNVNAIEKSKVHEEAEIKGCDNPTLEKRVISANDQPGQTGHVHPQQQQQQMTHNCSDEVTNIITIVGADPLRAFLLLTALSFHTVFDGIAVGLETTISGMWQMFAAIIVHKSLVSICLGLQLFLVYKSRPVKAVLWTLFFASIAPIGIGIGMILTSSHIDAIAKQLVNSFLQGIATGTFTYVIFFEILWEEIVYKRGFLRILLVALGFSIMGIVKYFVKE